MSSLNQLFLTNLRILYRDKSGFFWNILLPAGIYIVLSILPIGKIINTNLKYSAYVLPGIIAMAIMQSGIYSLAYWMVDLKARGVIKRFLVTPIKKTELIASLIASRLIVTLLQVIILTLVGIALFNVQFAGNYFSIILIVLLGGSIFLLIGLLISNLANSYHAMAPITSAIGLPLTFLGNIFYPLETLPGPLQIVAKILPITYMAEGLRAAYLQPFNFHNIAVNVLILAVWLIALLLLAIRVFKFKE